MNSVDGTPRDNDGKSSADAFTQPVIQTSQKRRRKWLTVLVVITVLVCLLLVACIRSKLTHRGEGDSDGLPVGTVSYDFVKSRPEAHLYYPGSKVFSPFGGAEERHLFGKNSSAFVGAVLTSTDSPKQIYQWYKDWMLSHGWQLSVFLRATGQTSIEGYARGSRERFYVAMEDTELLGGVLGRQVPQDEGTVFEIRYMIFPASK